MHYSRLSDDTLHAKMMTVYVNNCEYLEIIYKILSILHNVSEARRITFTLVRHINVLLSTYASNTKMLH